MSERPSQGYFFEDYVAGRVFRHAVPRTITGGDVALYIALTGSRQPLNCSMPLALAMGHRACPIDDMLVFNIAFGKTVADISYNAIANLGYADVRFLAPVYVGDTIACESEVIGLKANSNGKTGIVYVRSTARNQEGTEVLRWVRWVMVAARGTAAASTLVLPALPDEVHPRDFRIPAFLRPEALDSRATGSAKRWENYQPGTVIDHPSGMTVGASEHMLATRLYQNPARVHFDALEARKSAIGRRLVYGGHVISILRGLAHDGLENAFAIAAIHGGTHAHPTFSSDTLYCRHVVLARSEVPGHPGLGALRLRMIGIKEAALSTVQTPAVGEKHSAVVLDLDYSVLIPRGQNT